ncbi:hypothetical protein N7527_002103 [Penicillium freii]|nr:hypothetical protein N7527_002103 [Penicillium freii]
MASLQTFKLDVSDVELNVTLGEDRIAGIDVNLRISLEPRAEDSDSSSPVRGRRLAGFDIKLTLPPEQDSETDYAAACNSAGLKRKRDTTPERGQASLVISTIDPDSSSRVKGSTLSRLGTEEIDDKHQPPLDAMAPLDPLELPDLPPITTPNTRVWESHRPSNFNFPIYEDPQDQETPNVSPFQEGFHGIEEDKENIFLTTSDYAASDEEEEDTRPNLAGREPSIGLLDAFGLPLNRDMSDFVRPATNPIHERHMRRGREVFQTLWVDEPRVREEHNGRQPNDTLTDTRVQEVEQVEESIQRGRTRLRSDRQPALRENAPVQDPANFDNVRRILDFHQPEARRSVTPEVNQEPQQHQLEQGRGQDQ